MAHPKPYPVCVFCGAKADSREHAIPKWIAKRFGLREVELTEIEISTSVTRRKQAIRVSSFRARVFCRECNKHFKHLEDAVIPLIEPMGKGRPIVLGADSQRLLALWSAKTAVAIAAAGAPEFRDVVPVEHRASIRYKDLAPDNCWIGWFPFGGTTHLYAGSGTVTDEGVDPPVEYAVYSFVFTFAQLGFKVEGYSARFPRHVLDGDRQTMKQLWPEKTDMLVWPPAGPIGMNENLRAIIEFYPVERSGILLP